MGTLFPCVSAGFQLWDGVKRPTRSPRNDPCYTWDHSTACYDNDVLTSPAVVYTNLPEYLHNWLVAFLSQHTHCTDYNGQRSSMKKITASIIQLRFWHRPSDIQGGPKSKPLPNDQKIVLNRIKACQ